MCAQPKNESPDGGNWHRPTPESTRWLFLRRDPEFLDRIRHLWDSPRELIDPFVSAGQVAADLGCGSGYITLPLAERVGPQGKVYAVDLDEGCIRRVRAKAEKAGYRNVEAHASSASDLNFIPDRSIDFVIANGLLCSMHRDRARAVSEIQRILKPGGQAYLSLGMAPPFGLVNEDEWGQILSHFTVKDGGSWQQRWALVGLK